MWRSRLAGLVDIAPPTRFVAGATVCDADAGQVCEVIDGMVCTARVTDDGRRIVGGFFGAGDTIGVAPQGVRASNVEALSSSLVARCRRERLESLALVDARAARQMWAWLTLESERTSDRLSVLALGSAAQKVARFLIELVGRLGDGGRLELPMSRSDIGDYLSLSSETVSRTFTVLRQRGWVATDGRAVMLLRPDALAAGRSR